jgi:hypothetical protein
MQLQQNRKVRVEMTTKLDNLDNLNNSAQNLVRNKRGALGFLAVKNVQ